MVQIKIKILRSEIQIVVVFPVVFAVVPMAFVVVAVFFFFSVFFFFFFVEYMLKSFLNVYRAGRRRQCTAEPQEEKRKDVLVISKAGTDFINQI